MPNYQSRYELKQVIDKKNQYLDMLEEAGELGTLSDDEYRKKCAEIYHLREIYNIRVREDNNRSSARDYATSKCIQYFDKRASQTVRAAMFMCALSAGGFTVSNAVDFAVNKNLIEPSVTTDNIKKISWSMFGLGIAGGLLSLAFLDVGSRYGRKPETIDKRIDADEQREYERLSKTPLWQPSPEKTP